ncbi:MAG: Transposase protein [Mucilaginibacter sp.]|nr:Transposase protein [Mucilaginibacter sp.]
MIDLNKIRDIFCLVDEFCIDSGKTIEPFILRKPFKLRPSTMSKSEIISICL